MDARELLSSLFIVSNVLNKSFRFGVAIDSPTELADFRQKFLDEFRKSCPWFDENPSLADEFGNQQLVAIMTKTGCHALGRFFPIEMHKTVNDAVVMGGKLCDETGKRLVDLDVGVGKYDSSSARVLFLKSIHPECVIFYPETFLERRRDALDAFNVKDLPSLHVLIERRKLFPKKSANGRYYTNRDKSEMELVTETLFRVMVDMTQKTPSVRFRNLMRKICVPEGIARRALDAKGSPFKRLPNDFYAPVDPLRDPSDVVPSSGIESLRSMDADYFVNYLNDPVVTIVENFRKDKARRRKEIAELHKNVCLTGNIPECFCALDQGLATRVDPLLKTCRPLLPNPEVKETLGIMEYRMTTTHLTLNKSLTAEGAASGGNASVDGEAAPKETEPPQDQAETVPASEEQSVEAQTNEENAKVDDKAAQDQPEPPQIQTAAAPVSEDQPVEDQTNEENAKVDAEAALNQPEPPQDQTDAAPVSEEQSMEDQTNEENVGIAETDEARFEALETIGELLDQLFAERHAIVYYTTLMSRHEELFQKIGADQFNIKDKLREIRPQYGYEARYVCSETATGNERELVRAQLPLRWGGSAKTTLSKLAQNVYIPKTTVKQIVETYDEFSFDGINVKYRDFNDADDSNLAYVKAFLSMLEKRGHRIVFYQEWFKKKQTEFSARGIGAAEDLKAFVDENLLELNAGMKLRDFGDYLLMGASTAPRDEVVLAEIRLRYLTATCELIRERNKPHKQIVVFVQCNAPSVSGRILKERVLAPAELVDEILEKQTRYFRKAEDGKWYGLNHAGELMRIDNITEMIDEITNPVSDLNLTLNGAPNSRRLAGKPTPETPDGSGEDANPNDPIGALLDSLFDDSHVVLYYNRLLERHKRLFTSVGAIDPQGVRDAIRKARPEYNATELFVTREQTAPAATYALAIRQIELRWGAKKFASVKQLTADLYLPQRIVQKALESDSRFTHTSRDVFTFAGFEKPSAPQQEPAATAEEPTAAAPSEPEPTAPEPEPETPAPIEAGSPVESPAEPQSGEEDAQEPEEETPEPEEAPAPVKQPKKEPTTEERLKSLIDVFVSGGQTILYYRTLMERNAWLTKACPDEAAVQGAIRALFPSFGFYETFCEPRRRSSEETAEEKVRRSLILGWGDVDRFKLDKLATRFCVPSTILERVLKSYPEDFNAEGKLRFSITESARREAERIARERAKLAEDLKAALATDLGLLFYAEYFARNEARLRSLGLDTVKLLRRELANVNLEESLGFVFYQEFCERVQTQIRYRERLRRLIHANWGESASVFLGDLAESLWVPRAELRDVLDSSLDFVSEGAGVYRRVRDVDGNTL